MFDNEVSIMAYIQRLDVTEEVAERKKKLGVTTLTEVLRADIQQAGNMRKLLTSVEDQLAQAKSMNYDAMRNEEKIAAKMLEHGIILKFDSIVSGATVDLYRYSTTMGVKMSDLRRYADDIQQVLGAVGVRVLAPIPRSTLVGFEVPREERRWPAVPAHDGFNLAIGETIEGHVRRYDIREAPHMLVAGASGSGKSVFAHSLIGQLKAAGAEMVLIDPKEVEFSRYAGAITEKREIERAIAGLVETMNGRYKQLRDAGKRDAREAGWPPLFLIIDEYADLVGDDSRRKARRSVVTEERTRKGKVTIRETDGDDATIGDHIQRIAQKGRAAGIHIVLITQRASTKIITGDVKVNFPVKAVFRMAKAVDSQVMLDEDGAEKLLGKGDMLFSTDAGTERLQGYNAV
jgi:S-DNA-T family DNA segregation ATPase FtsK/SpoIIIE